MVLNPGAAGAAPCTLHPTQDVRHLLPELRCPALPAQVMSKLPVYKDSILETPKLAAEVMLANLDAFDNVQVCQVGQHAMRSCM